MFDLKIIFGNRHDGNCSMGDLRSENYAENQKRILARIGVDRTRFVQFYPLLDPKVAYVSERDVRLFQTEGEVRPEGDALVTNQPNIALGVVAADCMPLILADTQKGVLAVCHISRHMLASGLIDKTVTAMRQHGAGMIEAFMGPALQVDNHILKPYVLEELCEVAPHMKDFTYKRNKKLYFDFAKAVEDALDKNNVHVTFRSEICTYANEDFASRRRRYEKGGDTTLALSAAVLKPKGR